MSEHERPSGGARQESGPISVLINQAQELAAPILNHKRSGASASHYLKVFARLRAKKQRPEAALTKSTFYVYKAAWQFGVAKLIEHTLSSISDASSTNDHSSLERLASQLQTLIKELARYAPDYSGRPVTEREKSKWDGERTSKRSKRRGISALPSDWRTRIWHVISDQYREAVALLSIAGVRPEEIHKGVRVEVADSALHIFITGAKTDDVKGQPWRRLTIDPQSSEEAAWLFDRVSLTVAIGVEWSIRLPERLKDPKRALSAAIARASACLWPQRRAASPYRATAYSFRHAFAADLKSAGFDYEAIAKALGHSTERTQAMYGHIRTGRIKGRAPGVISIDAERTVREVASKPGEVASKRPALRS